MELQTKRLQLVEITADDLENIHQLHATPEVNWYNTLGLPETLEVTKAVLQEWLTGQQAIPQAAYIFCVMQPGTHRFMGLIGLRLGKQNYRIAEVWFKLLPRYWGQGFTTEALRQVLHFGFNTLALHRIEAGCAVGNIASAKVLEKVGMIREGRKRKILPIRGEWVDNFFYAILDTEFQSGE